MNDCYSYGIRIRFSSKVLTNREIKRTLWERLTTSGVPFSQKTRTVQIPDFYRVGDEIIAHPSLVTEVYKMVRKHEDAPTLKVKAVK